MLGNYHSESKAKNFLNYQENQETYEHTTMVNGLVLRKKSFWSTRCTPAGIIHCLELT